MDELMMKYPELFAKSDHNDPISLHGIECGKGWYDLLDSMFDTLTHDYRFEIKQLDNMVLKDSSQFTYKEERIKQLKINIEEKKAKLPIIEQIKSKFGSLRIYMLNENEFSRGITTLAEVLSSKICERCGNKSRIKFENNLTTECSTCSNK